MFRSTPVSIGARGNRRSTTLMRNRDHRVPIVIHGYRSAGKPAIPIAGAERAGCMRMPVVRGARRAWCRRTPVVRGARRARGESRAWASSGHGPSCGASPVHGRVPCMARHLPIPGPTWPVADAANRRFETFILVVCRGVLSGHVQRRG